MLQMSRGDPIFRSIEQARDVAAMAHDDERGREHAEHDVERWVAEYEREHGFITWILGEAFRKAGWIRENDLKLN